MSTVILFISYILISMIFTWKYVDFIKEKQWDIKSARILLAIFIAIIGLLLLSVRVAFLGGIEDGEKNVINLTLILGATIILIIVLLSLIVMHLVRKMKYVEVTFKISEKDSERGSLSEKEMTCLVDRKQVLNVQKIISQPQNTAISEENSSEEEFEIIEKK
ncbi:hypothetical protein CRV01_02680 [Arcobacter sp. CECT 8983]|uniref:hypothetical protein n=1 Tax=Arcobacter sp. CECT 8983 TaxID=2044508 RepID=UPI00100B8AE6|nr:hypothetical protein [Arcobacter sp. CECT 8983]RXJ91203.1 hypothetical protein CRV01_02680 [Arcobacter sp. CECT 8983]